MRSSSALGQVVVDLLAHVEGRTTSRVSAGDDAQRAEADDRTGEASPSASRLSVTQRAVGGDHVERRNRCGQDAVAVPEPWVPVAQAPATEMCGSEPRLGSASPCSCSYRASSPYRTPGAHGDRLASGSNDRRGGHRGQRDESPIVSAIALKEWPVPRARIRPLVATSSCSSGTLDGLENRAAL